MRQLTLGHFFSGIGFTATCIGLSVLGLALGSSLSSEIALTEHMLFFPGLFCTAVGMLSLMIIALVSSDEPES